MTLFDPETFADQPYVAGLNQGAHAVSGAALFGLFLLALHIRDALALTLLVTLSFEFWQLQQKAAVLWDTILDVTFWWLGALSWAWAVAWAYIVGPPVFFPLCLVVLMGTVMLAFTVIFTSVSNED